MTQHVAHPRAGHPQGGELVPGGLYLGGLSAEGLHQFLLYSDCIVHSTRAPLRGAVSLLFAGAVACARQLLST